MMQLIRRCRVNTHHDQQQKVYFCSVMWLLRPTMRKEDVLNLRDKSNSKSLSHALACGSKILKKKTDGSCVKKTKAIFSRNNSNSRRNLILQERYVKNSSCKVHRGDQNDILVTESLKLKRRKRKMKKENKDLDEPLRLQRRVRYLLVRLKLEQNLIDAYCAEGWNGQSREKIKPEKELQRAKKQILKCKLGIRDAIRQLDLMSSEGRIDDSLIAPDGSVHHEHIFCTKCKLQEASPDNDIILCDGTCNCGFHQKCLDPPLATEDIPPENEAWLCIYCEHKMEIMEVMNAHLGTQFSVNNTWKDIFKDEAASSDIGAMFVNANEEWPDDDSEDTDYEPDDGTNGCSGATSEENVLISEESFSSLSCSLENDDFIHCGLHAKENMFHNKDDSPDAEFGAVSGWPPDYVVVSGPRPRCAVDYKQLYDEMFGRDITNAETDDEDWGPPRKRRRGKERDAASTLMSLCESEKKLSDLQSGELEKEFPFKMRNRKPCSRIPIHAVEKLRQVFTENELPTRAIKQNLSDQLGLDFEKVNKWFKNARYEALKIRKVESNKGLNFCPSEAPNKLYPETMNDVANSVGSDCSLVAPEDYRKHLRRIKWRREVISSSMLLKKQKDRKTSACSPVSGTKIKARCNSRRILSFDTRHQVEAAKVQMEQLYQAETKLQKLQFILLTLSSGEANKSNEQCPSQWRVVYVPTTELKEKLV